MPTLSRVTPLISPASASLALVVTIQWPSTYIEYVHTNCTFADQKPGGYRRLCRLGLCFSCRFAFQIFLLSKPVLEKIVKALWNVVDRRSTLVAHRPMIKGSFLYLSPEYHIGIFMPSVLAEHRE
jgi:hypothetical protein